MTTLSRVIALLLLPGVLCAYPASTISTAYDFMFKLSNSPAFWIHWRVSNSTIAIGLEANTTGWVGFGLAEPEGRGMPGSDMVVGFMAGTSGAWIADRYSATKSAAPLDDQCQDWTLIGATSYNNLTIFQLSRALFTNDTSQDRPFTSGDIPVVWALGATQAYTAQAMIRGIATINFYGNSTSPNSSPLLTNTTARSYALSNYTVQNTSTVCKSFLLPNTTEHVVAMEAVLDNRTSGTPLLRRMSVYVCPQETATYQRYLNATTCDVSPALSECSEMMYTWTRDSGMLLLPSQAGFRTGSGGAPAIVVEFYYDTQSPVNDSSGVRFWSTSTLRANDAGMMAVGNVVGLAGSPISALATFEEQAFNCPSSCLSANTTNVTLISSMMHARALGAMMWTTLTSGGVTSLLDRVEFFDFNHQTSKGIQATLTPQDFLTVHCVYDATQPPNVRNTTTSFGNSPATETCQNFMMYYPRISGRSYCGQGSNNEAYCGPNNTIANQTWATEQNNTYNQRTFAQGTDSRGACPSPSPVVVAGLNTAADICRGLGSGVACNQNNDCCSKSCARPQPGKPNVCANYTAPTVTLAPSFTYSPTGSPTWTPTLSPTATPTQQPTQQPTPSPTVAPTPEPTTNLTTGNSWFFDVSLSVLGVTNAQWNDTTSLAVRSALASALAIPSSQIVIKGVRANPNNDGVLVDVQILAGNNATGSALVPLLNTTLDVTNTTQQQAPQVTQVQVTTVSSLNAPITQAPTIAPTSEPQTSSSDSNSTAIGLGVGLGVGLGLLLLLFLFCCARKAKNRGKNERDVKQWKTQQEVANKKPKRGDDKVAV